MNSRAEPIWITLSDVKLYHEVQLKRYGGLNGIRDYGALEGATDRPKNLFYYENADLHELAACYAHGIAKNHPFLDGNKRAAFAASTVFLQTNGFYVTLSEEEATLAIRGLAEGTMSQTQLATLFREKSRKIEEIKTVEPTKEISQTKENSRDQGREM